MHFSTCLEKEVMFNFTNFEFYFFFILGWLAIVRHWSQECATSRKTI